jgi:hypothetical protein
MVQNLSFRSILVIFLSLIGVIKDERFLVIDSIIKSLVGSYVVFDEIIFDDCEAFEMNVIDILTKRK